MLRRSLTLIGIVGAIGLSCSSAWGFDGQRKGFVVGGGIGFSPFSRWSGPITVIDPNTSSFFVQDFDESKAGLGLNLLIGYAWDEQNMVVFEGNVTAFKSNIFIGDQTVSQGFNGAAWYHYYGPMGSSFYSVLGLGLFVFDLQDFDANDPGVGGLIGGGFEFSKHWQVGAYLSAGQTSDGLKDLGFGDWSHIQVSALVSVVAF